MTQSLGVGAQFAGNISATTGVIRLPPHGRVAADRARVS